MSDKARIWLAPNDSLVGRVWCWWFPPSWHRDYEKHNWRVETFGYTRSFETTRMQLIAALNRNTN